MPNDTIEDIELSLIVPAYNEEGNIKPFFEAMANSFESFEGRCEIIFIDDGSLDGTFLAMKETVRQTSDKFHVKAISFSRNFGKEAALFAGLEHATGRFQCFIDSDLQQKPETALEMYELLRATDECDCVAAYQEKRNQSKIVAWFSERFYKMFEQSSGMNVIANASDFRVFKRDVAEALLSMPEYHRFSKGLFAWVGFKTLPYPYTPDERHSGDTSWSVKKLAKYAIDGLLSFTTTPLKIATYIGVITSIAAFIYLTVVVAQRLVFGIDVPGYASIVALVLLIGGVQLLVLGVMGEYIARMCVQSKARPIYIARQVIDSHEL